MKLPVIIFRQSFLYDRSLKRMTDVKKFSEKERAKAFKKLQKEWNIFGKRVLTAISKITKLPWNEKEVVVYLTEEGVYPYSDPVTMTPKCNIHDLTHELIHRILSEKENWPKFKKNWESLMKKYKAESGLCKGHIPIHAIHWEILISLFGEKTLNNEIQRPIGQDYIRAWDIVKKEGNKTIIKKLTLRLK